MATERDDPKICERENRWNQEVARKLPELLTQLLDSPIYGLGDGRELPPVEPRYGVYLFSERGRPCYVGRVGLTDRSKLAGKAYSSFRTRLRGHVRPRHNQGTYAYGLTVKHFQTKKLPLAGTRKANCEDPAFMAEFQRQCERIRRMDIQVVEITDNRLAAVFEIYAATALGLDGQTFAVS
jgi:hypothetical protein